jgi:hypothetical protein
MKFHHDLPRNYVYKNASNKLSFLLVTYMTHVDIRFGRYGALKFCFWTRCRQIRVHAFGQVFGPKDG